MIAESLGTIEYIQGKGFDLLTTTCSKCHHSVRPVFAKKADQGLEFPPRIIAFEHPQDVICANPRTLRERLAVRETIIAEARQVYA